jgi:Histidine phosphatase superfamily (branch 1)
VLPVYQHHSAAVTGTQACRSTSRTNSAVDQTLRVVRVRLLSSQSSNSGSSSDPIETGPCNTWNIDRTSTNCQSLNQNTPYTLCFLRHGQSTWNRDNRFIGWTDTPLTDDGVLEARVAGQMLAKSGILFDEVRTTNIVLMEMQQEYIPVHKHWRLNERNYGDLVGLNKKETVEKHGKEQVRKWRRSYDEPPPPMNPKHPYHPNRDPRYKNVSVKGIIH